MTYTLSKLLVDAMKMQGEDAFDIRVATGGSTTTMEDTTLEDKYSDDELKNGTVIIIRSSNGLSPEGEFSRITGYSESDMEATFGALTEAIDSGDRVMIVSPEYPLTVLIELANDAIRDCGEITLDDTSSTTTVASITEYDLPVNYKNLVGVYIQTSKETNNNEWIPITSYKISPSAGGVNAKIIFDDPFDAGWTLKFVYNTSNERVEDYNDPINENIKPSLVSRVLADKIISWKGVTNETVNSANRLRAELDEAKGVYRVKREKIPTNFLTWGAS